MAALFSCPGCGFSRGVADADMGKRAKCPKCGGVAPIVAGAVATADPVQAKARRDQTVMGAPVAERREHEQRAHDHHEHEHGIRATPPPVSAAAAVPGAPRDAGQRQWHYSLDGDEIGPVSEDELRALIRRGMVRAGDSVWSPGMKKWAPADEYFEFVSDEDDRPRWRRRRRRREGDAPGSGGQVCGILACVFGGVAFIFCPILFGLAGIVLGIVSACLSENKTLGIVGIVVSCVGLVVGIFLGILVFSAMQFGGF